jgi:hypothetical protein
MRIVLLVWMLGMGGCATTPVGRAVQTTSVGGGLVAIGSVGLAGVAVVGGAALATLPEESRQTLFLPLAISVGVDVGLLALGGCIMYGGGKDLDEAWPSAEPRPTVPPARPRTSKREPRRAPVARKPPASMWEGGPPAKARDGASDDDDDDDDDDAKPIRRLKD